jgi:hypothetical protein
MVRVVLLLFLAYVALLVVALIDCLSSEEYEIRKLPKIVWVFVILLPIGSVAWFVAGRPARNAPQKSGVWQPGNGFPESVRPRRTVAPDDDPEFLRGLAKSKREDEELLRQWEADLRRREEELRKRDQPSDGEASEN